jgi:N-formylglutamate deformylase
VHKTEIEGIYQLIEADDALPLIFDSPHSGAHYPRNFYFTCPFALLERAEDKYVDELFANAPQYGAHLLAALFPRSYIDVNRAEDDIDHELLEEIWPEESNPSARSFAGIGLVRRLVNPGTPVYSTPLSVEEVQHRIETYYRPYHAALGQLIDDAHCRFGQVVHINCHSMPSQSTSPAAMLRPTPFRMPDFVLGDRNGTTCDLSLTHGVRDFLKGLGYSVAINDPYKGVECVRRYAAPAMGRHSLQIEINKALYMNEETCEKHKGFNLLQENLNLLMQYLADYTHALQTPLAAD